MPAPDEYGSFKTPCKCGGEVYYRKGPGSRFTIYCLTCGKFFSPYKWRSHATDEMAKMDRDREKASSEE